MTSRFSFSLLLALLLLFSVACSLSAVPAVISDGQPTANASNSPKSELDGASPVEKVEKTPSSTVTAQKLNIRTGPGTDYPVIPHVYLARDERIVILECWGVWGRIGSDRWINTVYTSSEVCK